MASASKVYIFRRPAIESVVPAGMSSDSSWNVKLWVSERR